MNLTSIAIIHATRGRPWQAVNSAKSLVDNMTTDIKITYVFSADNDDPRLTQYGYGRLPFPTNFITADNNGAVQAMNRGATLFNNADLLMVHSDDVTSPHGWDQQLKDFVATIPIEIYYVHCSNIQGGRDKAIVPLLSKAFYKQQGFIFDPDFRSMYADDWLVEVARRQGILYETSIDFVHNHPIFGKGLWDDTYRRSNAPANYSEGLEVFNRKKQQTLN